MITKVDRKYLEINSIEEINLSKKPKINCKVEKKDPPDFQINKFFYKQIGKKHEWTDRLIWQDKNWIDYVSNEKVETYILQTEDDLIGYFELIFENNNCELAYLGILEEYIGKGLGGFLLSEALKIGLRKSKRVWAHTCSLDHPNAIENYKLRGMKIFKTETIRRKVI